MGEIDERYKRGKIYTVRCRYDDSMIYVGSTIHSLAKRIGAHRRAKDNHATNLYNVVQDDWSNWYIELYENFPCNNKQELERREGQVIREIGSINKKIAGRTKEEYHKENYERDLQILKDWRIKNNDKIKKNYEDNREEILIKKKEIVKCNICGCEVTKSHLSRHKKTKKCINFNQHSQE